MKSCSRLHPPLCCRMKKERGMFGSHPDGTNKRYRRFLPPDLFGHLSAVPHLIEESTNFAVVSFSPIYLLTFLPLLSPRPTCG